MTILGTIWSAAPLPALGNDRRSRKAHAALAKKQRAAARMLCLASLRGSRVLQISPSLIVVTLTRVHPPGKGITDTDGLAATFKHVRDGIADWLGVDDSPRTGIEWRYTQRPKPANAPYTENATWFAQFTTRSLIAPMPLHEVSGFRRLLAAPETTREIQSIGENTFQVLIEGYSEAVIKATVKEVIVSAVPYEAGQFVVRVVLR